MASKKAALAKLESEFKKAQPSKLTFNPAKGTLLIRRTEEESTTKAGLFIPDQAKEKPQEGVIVATHLENVYGAGVRVLFGKYAGTDIKLNDEVLLLLNESDVLGSLTGGK